MNIIIFGTGLYVTGDGKHTNGTILPSLIEFQKKYTVIKQLIFIKKNHKNISETKKKIKKIMIKFNLSINFEILVNNKNLDTNLARYGDFNFSIISLPDNLHYKYIKYSLNNNWHCLVVKPFTLKSEEAKELIKIAKKKNLYGVIDFHKRFDKHNLIIKNQFNNKELGSHLYSIVEYSQRKIIPTKFFKQWCSHTNILNYLGSHYIDLFRFISVSKPSRVMAIGQKNFLVSRKLNTYDSIQCCVEWVSSNNLKFIQTLNVNWIDPLNTTAMSDQKIQLIFTKGRIESDQKNRGLNILSDKSKINSINPDFCYEFSDENGFSTRGYGIDSILQSCKDVMNLNNNSVDLNFLNLNRPSFHEGLFSTVVLEAAQKSLDNNNKWISVKIS
jgi:predicted dehydrogenase